MNVWMAEIWRAWRASLRRPGFLLLASGVLALGIGASAGAFTLVENVLLKPLPFPQPQQLVMMERTSGPHATSGISPRQYRHMQGLAGVVSMGLILNPWQKELVDVNDSGKPVFAQQTRISAGLLRALDVHVAVGRRFNAGEYTAHGPPAVLLSHGFWLRHFGGDAGVVGEPIRVGGRSYTVVGVLPASFSALNRADIVRPMASDAMMNNRDGAYIAVARLDGSRTPAQVAAQATAGVHAALRASTQSDRQLAMLNTHRIGAYAPRTILHRNSTGTVIGLLQICGLLVLIVALVNLVNLMVMRASQSAHAQAVRGSLGAAGLRLALPVLAESLLVALLSAFAGVVLGRIGIGLLQHWLPIPGLAHASLQVGPNVWGLAVGGAVVVSLLAAWLGQHRARRAGIMDELREGASSGVGLRAGRLGRVLVIAQVALATVGVMAAAMIAHAVFASATGTHGLDANHTLVFHTKPPATAVAEPGAASRLAKRVRTRLRDIPGVVEATVTTHLPLGPTHTSVAYDQAHGGVITASARGVDDAYFRTFGIAMITGHGFTQAQLADGARVAIINQHMAKKVFHGEALGAFLGTGSHATRIVGVVADAGLSAAGHSHNGVYLPLHRYGKTSMWVVAVRTHGAPTAYRDAVRATMAAVAPHWPVAHMRTMQQAAGEATRASRTNLLLVGMLAGLTLLLAAVGQYAVMMSAVAASEREFGIRMALGASPVRLVRRVMAVGMRRIVLGLLIGAAFGVIVSLLMRHAIVLLGRSPIDPWAIAATCLVLMAAGLLACLIPALRAARVQPMHALKGE